MELYGVIGDIHGPWNDDRKTKLAFDVMKDQKITHLILNGDILDFYCINAHGPKDPDIQTKLEDEMQWGRDFLQYLRKKFPSIEIIYIYGNHEFRIDRFVMANCPVFWNVLQLDKMLMLKELNIKWIPYNERFRLGKSGLYVQHSPPSYSDNAAATSFRKKLDEDHIWNCTHRTDRSVKTGASGKTYTTFINGWFGSRGIIEELQNQMPENKKVFQYTKNHEQWNCSFSLVTVDGSEYFVDQVIIKNNKCMVGNIIYEG